MRKSVFWAIIITVAFWLGGSCGCAISRVTDKVRIQGRERTEETSGVKFWSQEATTTVTAPDGSSYTETRPVGLMGAIFGTTNWYGVPPPEIYIYRGGGSHCYSNHREVVWRRTIYVRRR